MLGMVALLQPSCPEGDSSSGCDLVTAACFLGASLCDLAVRNCCKMGFESSGGLSCIPQGWDDKYLLLQCSILSVHLTQFLSQVLLQCYLLGLKGFIPSPALWAGLTASRALWHMSKHGWVVVNRTPPVSSLDELWCWQSLLKLKERQTCLSVSTGQSVPWRCVSKCWDAGDKAAWCLGDKKGSQDTTE